MSIDARPLIGMREQLFKLLQSLDAADSEATKELRRVQKRLLELPDVILAAERTYAECRLEVKRAEHALKHHEANVRIRGVQGTNKEMRDAALTVATKQDEESVLNCEFQAALALADVSRYKNELSALEAYARTVK